MLNEKELRKFLAALLGFATTLMLSDRSMASLLGISNKTMSRWLALARVSRDGGTPDQSIYHHIALEVTNKLGYLDAHDQNDGLYGRVIPLSRADRIHTLVTTLATRRV